MHDGACGSTCSGSYMRAACQGVLLSLGTRPTSRLGLSQESLCKAHWPSPQDEGPSRACYLLCTRSGQVTGWEPAEQAAGTLPGRRLAVRHLVTALSPWRMPCHIIPLHFKHSFTGKGSKKFKITRRLELRAPGPSDLGASCPAAGTPAKWI